MSAIYHRDFSQGLDGKYAKVMAHLTSKAKGSVLEIGCHTGYFSRVLLNNGFNVLGVERDETAARQARDAGVSVIEGDISDPDTIAKISAQFDVVLLMDVLEHLVDPCAVLQRLKPRLKAGGRVLITGPNVAYWAVRLKLLSGCWDYADTGILDRTHLHFYTAATWKQLAESAGYDVTSTESAEAMVPLEHILKRVNSVNFFRHVAAAAKPDLFTVVYLIEAVPS